jgi:murein DD-endopeptidase MepM/ murein hydrolase activator NlpD
MILSISCFPIVIPGRGKVSFRDSFSDDGVDGPMQSIDIAAPDGAMIVATAAGTVVGRWWSGRGAASGCGYDQVLGNLVLIADATGHAHLYAGLLAPPRLRPGDNVAEGAILGLPGRHGASGRAARAGLRYQVFEVGRGREGELAAGAFTRPFSSVVNPFPQLLKLAKRGGATVRRSGEVVFNGAAIRMPPMPRMTIGRGTP